MMLLLVQNVLDDRVFVRRTKTKRPYPSCHPNKSPGFISFSRTKAEDVPFTVCITFHTGQVDIELNRQMEMILNSTKSQDGTVELFTLLLNASIDGSLKLLCYERLLLMRRPNVVNVDLDATMCHATASRFPSPEGRWRLASKPRV